MLIFIIRVASFEALGPQFSVQPNANYDLDGLSDLERLKVTHFSVRVGPRQGQTTKCGAGYGVVYRRLHRLD